MRYKSCILTSSISLYFFILSFYNCFFFYFNFRKWTILFPFFEHLASSSRGLNYLFNSNKTTDSFLYFSHEKIQGVSGMYSYFLIKKCMYTRLFSRRKTIQQKFTPDEKKFPNKTYVSFNGESKPVRKIRCCHLKFQSCSPLTARLCGKFLRNCFCPLKIEIFFVQFKRKRLFKKFLGFKDVLQQIAFLRIFFKL